MEMMIFIVFAFLVLVYVYSFIKIRRKMQKKNKSEVLEFQKKYHKNNIANHDDASGNSNYTKYITKYNSSVDYINKDEL